MTDTQAETKPAINDGGAAFPTQELRDGNGIGLVEGGYGMSLRDWFAGQALAQTMRDCGGDYAVKSAYEYADAMLAARATGGV